MSARALAVWTLIYGVLWNALGWAGNNLLLGAAWDAAGAQATPGFSPPYAGVAREAMTLLPDFIYAFAFVWLFGRMRAQTPGGAVALIMVIWLAGAVVTYLAMVTSGFLPWLLAVETSALALVIFLATAPILPVARRRGN